MAAAGPLSRSNAIWILAGLFACAGAVALIMRSAVSADVEDGSDDERLASVQRIASSSPPGARAALVRAARNDTSARVRKVALISLGHIRSDEDRGVFEDSTRDKDARVRAVAADSLGSYADSAAVGVLVDLVRNDPSDRVRIGALRGLARCDDPRAVVCLLNTAEAGRTNEIKLQAMRSIFVTLRANIRQLRDPRDQARWRDMIQRLKWHENIRNAYAAVGAELVHHPEHILGKDWHPERRDE